MENLGQALAFVFFDVSMLVQIPRLSSMTVKTGLSEHKITAQLCLARFMITVAAGLKRLKTVLL